MATSQEAVTTKETATAAPDLPFSDTSLRVTSFTQQSEGIHRLLYYCCIIYFVSEIHTAAGAISFLSHMIQPRTEHPHTYDTPGTHRSTSLSLRRSLSSSVIGTPATGSWPGSWPKLSSLPMPSMFGEESRKCVRGLTAVTSQCAVRSAEARQFDNMRRNC